MEVPALAWKGPLGAAIGPVLRTGGARELEGEDRGGGAALAAAGTAGDTVDTVATQRQDPARRRRSQKETKILLKQMVPLGPPDAQPQNQLRPCPGLGNTVTIYPHLPIYISAPKNYVMSGNSHKYCNLLASWRINRVYLAGRVSFFLFSFLLFFSLMYMFINLRVFVTELFLRC